MSANWPSTGPNRSRGSGGIGRGWIVWLDDPDRGDRLVISRQLHLETPVLLEREPLPVAPVSSVATGLLRELGTVGAGIDGHRLPGDRASHDPRVDRHGDGHLMCRQRHGVVLHTTLVAKNHPPILRACSIPGPYFDMLEPTLIPPSIAGSLHVAEPEPPGASGLAADFLHLTDRGYLRARAFADVAVFGSDT